MTCEPLGSKNDSNLRSENMGKLQNVGSRKDPPQCQSQSQSQESSVIDDNFIPPPPSLGTN